MPGPVHNGKDIDIHTHIFLARQSPRLLPGASLHPNLYADTSALSLPHRKRYLLKLLKHTEAHHKLIHGSDFPLPISAWGFLGHLPVAQIFKINRIESPILRDYVIKKELGFPKEVFTHAGEIIRRSS